MVNRRNFMAGGLGAGALALMPGLAGRAWAADAKSIDDLAAAAKGQTLNMIMDPYDAHSDIVAVFAQKFPDVNVQATKLHPSDAAPKVMTEQQNGLYNWDCWWGTCSNMNNVVRPAGGLESIDPFLVLDEVTDPDQWELPDYRFTSKESDTVFVHSHFLINYGAYDKDQVPNGMLTLDNITDPSLIGKISIRSPNRPHGGTMMLAQVAKSKDMDTVKEILTTMKPVFIDNDRQNTMSVIRGDTAVGIGTNEETLYDCHSSQGCTNIAKFPVSVMHSRGISVFKNAPHAEATALWANWLLSKDGQETYVREWARTNPGGAVSMRKDVAPAKGQEDSVVDPTAVDNYVAVSMDSGTADLKAVMDLFKSIRA